MTETPNPSANPPADPTAAAATQNLAERYNYNQLDAAHKAMADKVMAVILAVPDIKSINDPVALKKHLDELKKQNGDQTDLFKSVADMGIPGISGFAQSIVNFDSAAQNAGDLAKAGGQGAAIAALPLTVPLAVLGEEFNTVKELFNDMTPEKARTIATGYASVMQAREADRQSAGLLGPFSGFHGDGYLDGAKNGFGNLLAYLEAFFSWAAENVTSWFNHQPTHSFEEHLNHALFNSDMHAVSDNMATAPTIPNGKDWGKFLTEGGQGQDAAGHNKNVDKPTPSDPTPDTPGAHPPGAGDPPPAPEEKDPVKIVLHALVNGAKAGAHKVHEAVDGVNTPTKVGAAAVGVGLTLNGVRGFTEGAVRAGIKIANHKAVEFTEKAAQFQKKADAVSAKVTKAYQESAPIKKIQKLEAREAAYLDKVAEFSGKADKFETLKGNRLGFWNKFVGLGDAAMEPTKGKGLVHVWNLPRNTMRMFGEWTGNVTGFVGGAPKNFGEGVLNGVSQSVNGADAKPATTVLESMGGFVGKWGSKGIKVLVPVTSAIETGGNFLSGDNKGAAIHGTELVGTVALATFGTKRFVPGVSVIAPTAEFTNAVVHNDKRGITTHGVGLATVGAGLAAGAGIGALAGFGILDWVTIPAGAVIGSTAAVVAGVVAGASVGATTGSLVSIGTEHVAGMMYDNHAKNAEKLAAAQNPAPTHPPVSQPHPGLAVAAADTQARAQAAAAGGAMRAHSVQHGATLPPGHPIGAQPPVGNSKVAAIGIKPPLHPVHALS